jgi:chemotaxis protein CheD
LKKFYDSKFKTDVTIIGQGEYFASATGDIITTTLGSCVSICIFDDLAKVGGMNHYMLPEPVSSEKDIIFGHAKYGVISMELLINECIKLGAKKANLKAKVFGGANMFASKNLHTSVEVGKKNIDFAHKYLALEKIQIVSEDLAKDHARKIYFDPANGFVKLFRITNEDVQKVIKSEISYEKKVIESNKPSLDDKITMF